MMGGWEDGRMGGREDGFASSEVLEPGGLV